MSNILNSQISSDTNPIPAWNLRKQKSSRLVQAPKTMYTYSIDDELRKSDEFRKNVTLAQNNELYNKKSSIFPKTCAILAAVTAYFMFKCK